MLKYWLPFNIFISLFMFGFIFYAYAGISGGDLAILFSNIFFGIFQIIAVRIISKSYLKVKATKTIVAICLIQLTALIVFIQWGYTINEWLK